MAVGVALAIGSLLFIVWQVLDVLLLLFAGLLMGLFLSTLARLYVDDVLGSGDASAGGSATG